jgi:hypothetical protein
MEIMHALFFLLAGPTLGSSAQNFGAITGLSQNYGGVSSVH